MQKNILIVGCGLSGAVLAQQFAEDNYKVTIIDKRNHIGGNCYDYVDEDTGILMNKYGAHLFHTNDEEVYKYVHNYSDWVKWEHTVVGKVDNKIVPIPVNIDTINALFDLNIKTTEEMDIWLKNNQCKYQNGPQNGEEAAKARVGDVLFDKIFKYYTKKQWDKFPDELDASVLQRIPVRNNFDNRYFTDKYQILPKDGYTKFFANLLSHDNINIKLNVDYFTSEYSKNEYDAVIYTGPVDRYFENHDYPKLEYRSINFVKEIFFNKNKFQDYSVVNYPENDVQFTRIVEYKHFLNQESNHTVIVTEYTVDNGDPYYPVPNKANKELYEKYKLLADNETKRRQIFFVGRLANYKYFNMDQAIRNALDLYPEIKSSLINNKFDYFVQHTKIMYSVIIKILSYYTNAVNSWFFKKQSTFTSRSWFNWTRCTYESTK